MLPIIFPIPIAAFFFIAAIITVISSGREVPRAKIVKPITVCAIPMLVKNANDSDKNNLPPIKKPKKLNVNLIKFISLACFSSEISTLDENEMLFTEKELAKANGACYSRFWKQCPTKCLPLCLPCNCLLHPCRKAVSKDKNRYEEGTYSLDLVYLFCQFLMYRIQKYYRVFYLLRKNG